MFRDTSSPDWSSQVTPSDSPSFDETPVNLDDALKEAQRTGLSCAVSGSRKISTNSISNSSKPDKPQFDLQTTIATHRSGRKCGERFNNPGAQLFPSSPAISIDANSFLLSQIQDIQRRAVFPIAVSPTVTTPALAPSDLVGGYGKTLSNLFSLNTYNVTVGVAIQIPFKNKTAKANLAGANIQQEQLQASLRSQAQAVEVDVRNSAQAVDTSRRRVLSAREARVNAELQLEGEQRLYQVGRSTTFLLFQRQNALTNARASELRAQTDYNKALADLQRATSTTLRVNNVIVESPVP